ncbi:pyridoxal phosphate-dependent aminotransferase [Desulfitobacterium sp. Sab5]|uniref:pyridoxal phosphate-dependent aminotransferase n=1 Tax=Desulfitobacterium nosdiversum TaxID=3375356 RepID=UPI003CECA742
MISNKVKDNLSSSSLVRKMFEEGEALRKIYGSENVFDFSLGNPDPEPPLAVKETLKRLVQEDKPGLHSYMNNAGYSEVREKVADNINKETGRNLTYRHIVMTCGAGGALNVVFKTILNPDEEVIVFTPFFSEYRFYVDNHGGKLIEIPSLSETFEPDLNRLEGSINSKTKAIIINSPNNPTGVVYSEKVLKAMAEVLERKERELNTTIYLISDEPYNKLVYDNIVLPKVLNIFKNSIIVNSFSKSHSLPGGRIGYIAVNDQMDNVQLLMDGLTFCNRTLGYINAPGIYQKVISETLDEVVDKQIYEERRNILYNHLIKLGFSCIKPQGAFYIFPKSLIKNDIEFKDRALKHNLIIVPGSVFGVPGYFRLSYCVSLKTIEKSLSAFEALASEF